MPCGRCVREKSRDSGSWFVRRWRHLASVSSKRCVWSSSCCRVTARPLVSEIVRVSFHSQNDVSKYNLKSVEIASIFDVVGWNIWVNCRHLSPLCLTQSVSQTIDEESILSFFIHDRLLHFYFLFLHLYYKTSTLTFLCYAIRLINTIPWH